MTARQHAAEGRTSPGSRSEGIAPEARVHIAERRSVEEVAQPSCFVGAQCDAGHQTPRERPGPSIPLADIRKLEEVICAGFHGMLKP